MTQLTATHANHSDHNLLRQFSYHTQTLKDKIILVTGAGSGIGKEVAKTYGACGATVLLMGKTQSKLEAVYDEIEQRHGATPAILPLDLAKAGAEEIQAITGLIEQEFGRLDGLVHNAGVLGRLTPLEMYDPTTFYEVMQVNFMAVFCLTHALMPLLKSSQSASVLFTTSTVGHDLRAFWGAYALSKQGVEGLMTIFTAETARHTALRFNTINPGAVRTNMRAHAYPGEDPFSLKTPAELMTAYVALMADEFADVKGQTVDLQPKF